MPKRRTNQKPRSNEYRIKRIIMQGYDKTTRPVSNDKSSLDVQVSISLYHILDTVSNILYFIPVTRHLSGKNPVAVISYDPYEIIYYFTTSLKRLSMAGLATMHHYA